jgi:hypothetical protein
MICSMLFEIVFKHQQTTLTYEKLNLYSRPYYSRFNL